MQIARTPSTPRRILVPVDFSPCAAAATRYAAGLAAPLGAQLELLHVWSSPHPLSPAEALPPLAVFAHTQAGQELKAFLHELALEQRTGVLAQARLAHGDPAEIIVELAERGAVDLIIMGRHGRGRLRRLFIGSVAEAVCRRSPVPVLTLHDDRFVAEHAVDAALLAAAQVRP